MYQRIAHANDQAGRLVDVLFEFPQISANRPDLQIACALLQFVKQFLAEINRDDAESPFGKRQRLTTRPAAKVERKITVFRGEFQAGEQFDVGLIRVLEIPEDP